MLPRGRADSQKVTTVVTLELDLPLFVTLYIQGKGFKWFPSWGTWPVNRGNDRPKAVITGWNYPLYCEDYPYLILESQVTQRVTFHTRMKFLLQIQVLTDPIVLM